MGPRLLRHTYVAGVRSFGNVVIVNPCALARCERPSLAVIRLPELQVTPIVLDLGLPAGRSRRRAGR